MNATFNAAVTALVKAVKADANFFGQFIAFAHSVITDPVCSDWDNAKKAEGLKNVTKNEEAAYAEANPKAEKLSLIVAYRSAKSVVMQCVAQGIPLVDEAGKARGKTELQNALKEAKGASEKTAEEKCGIALATFEACLSAVDDVEALKRLASRVAGILSGMSDAIKASV